MAFYYDQGSLRVFEIVFEKNIEALIYETEGKLLVI